MGTPRIDRVQGWMNVRESCSGASEQGTLTSTATAMRAISGLRLRAAPLSDGVMDCRISRGDEKE